MTSLTFDEIDKIIDAAEPHAKVVHDRIYDEVTKEIGTNDSFKNITDQVFDDVASIAVKWLRKLFKDLTTIRKYLYVKEIGEHIQFLDNLQTSRANIDENNFITKSLILFINRSVYQAFTEKLAEYVGVDLSDIINIKSE